MAQGRAPIIWAGAVMVIAATVLVASGRGPLPVFLVLTTLLITFLLIRESLQEVEAKPAEVDTKNALPIGFGRAMLERMPSALFVITRRGRVTYANQAALELLSNLRIGDHFANLFRAPDFVDAVNLALMEGESRQVSFTVLQDTKRYYEARVGLLPEGSDFGDSVHAIVQIEDRTTDKRAEDMRSDFIANASHELRTPLASILGYIETLRGHAKDDPEAREQFLEIMQKQAQRMQRLVEDLMSLSRIEMNEHVRP
ncbi:MAG TPA: histidine kinase dimerization/phospho-acceptor domain-containing protein, partial [Paracoccaceae bacterium]|nr:histidine kinase dimerization/phospho-acceptor domain-containing protein [Paracoccaceae bacterium]